MPKSTLSWGRLLELLPPGVPPATLEDRLFASKAEATRGEGDALEVEVTPDRLDLLSEGGLALELQGGVGAAAGLPRITRRRRSDRWAIRVEPSVDPIRPAIAGVMVRAPRDRPLDDGLLAEAVRFQELLHATVGRDRRAMSLGIYPAGSLEPPIRYSLEPLDAVRFVPLHGDEEVPAERFFQSDPMAARYGALGLRERSCLTLRDAEGTILSLPPVLNSRTGGEARPGDRELLLESTGTRARSVRDGLGLLLVVFAARGWGVAPVPLQGQDGAVRDTGEDLLAPHSVGVATSIVRAITGEELRVEEIVRRLGRARLGARRVRGGVRVRAPPWRPDLLTPADAVEDIALVDGVRVEAGLVPPSPTRGHRLPEQQFRRHFATLLLGYGLAQPHTSLLVAESTVREVGDAGPIALTNPVSSEYAFLRDRVLLSHLEVLGRNTRHAYPQRFAEVGPIVRRAPTAESGAETRSHASAILAAEASGFADAAALVEYLLRGFDVASVREPCELPATVRGRAACVRVAGEAVAEIGELHPEILSRIGVPVPASWAEVDLSALWPFVRGRVSA